jgi:hypothetical protein
MLKVRYQGGMLLNKEAFMMAQKMLERLFAWR